MAQVIHDGVVQRLITFFLADLDHARDLVRLAFAHQVGNGEVDDQDFERSHPARLINALEEILRDDAFERFGERGANLILLVSGKYVDDTIYRLRRAGGVQSSEDKVTRGRGR